MGARAAESWAVSSELVDIAFGGGALWRELNHGLWASPREWLASLGGIASLVSFVIALRPHDPQR
jgi:hypothetical protein